jgi:SAM-dependent methyltransferase
MEYDPTQYVGAAPYYRRGRPPYSAQLGAVLAAELGLDGTGRLLDVGSGPGILGVQLAPLFERVTLLEPDPGMRAEARSYADERGVTVELVPATAEQLPGLGLPQQRVVTFGQSFHRVDRVPVAEAVHALLEPGGALVLVSHVLGGPAPDPPPGVPPIPHEELRDLVRSYLGPELRSGGRLVSAYVSERFEETLARTPFGTPRIVHAPGRPDLVREVDDVVANYLSFSFAAPHLFGDRLDDFVAEMRALLLARSPSGRLWDWPGDTELVVARR